jgi:hypothetical protein
MKRLALIGFLCFAVLLPTLAAAQEGPLPMVWVRYYNAQPGQSQDLMGMIQKYSAPVLDGLQADGAVIGWGVAVPFTRQDGDWSHMMWIAAKDWAELDTLVARFDESTKDMTAEDMAAFEATVVPGSIRDVVLRHVVMPGWDPADTRPLEARYIKANYFKSQPGMEGELVDIYQSYAVPAMVELLQQGVVKAAGMSVQEIQSDSNWSHMAWFFTDDLAGLAKVRDARLGYDDTLSDEDVQSLSRRYRIAVDEDAMHSEVMMVIHVGGGE